MKGFDQRAVWHVTSKGVSNENIFRDEADRSTFRHVLSEVVDTYEWKCLSETELGNHYHLGVVAPVARLSEGMQQLNGQYSRRFNKRWDRKGHLFQAVFDRRIVELGPHLLNVIRYDVFNPVRHGFVESPEQWRGSSFRATSGMSPAPSWLDVKTVLRLFDADETVARRKFKDFVLGGPPPEDPWRNAQLAILGDASFTAAAEEWFEVSRLGTRGRLARFVRWTLDQVDEATARVLGSNSALRRGSEDARAAFALVAREGRHTVTDIASFLGVHKSTVSRLIQEAQSNRSPEFAHSLEGIRIVLRNPGEQLQTRATGNV